MLIQWIRIGKSIEGSVRLGNGTIYNYFIGDGIPANNRTFSGIQIILPKAMPHLYLDSHGDSVFVGPRRTYSNSQRLELEGNFNKYFQLFVPSNYQVLALSILTPEVLQMLISDSKRYDIEIKYKHINIISRKKVGTDPKAKAKLVATATKIVEEIDHKLMSWSKENEKAALKSQLEYYDEESIKVFGRYYGVGRFAVVTSLVISLCLYSLAYVYWKQESAEPIVILGLAILVFPGFPMIMYYLRYKSNFD